MNESEFYKIHHKQIWHKGKGLVYEHRLKVEAIIGRLLTIREEVHHHYNWDGSASLVLCPDGAYHSLLHVREKALRYCGNANWRKCVYCKQYDDTKNLSINKSSTAYHKSCAAEYRWIRRNNGI